MGNRQEVWVSLKNEDKANDFERRSLVGIEWSNGMFVTGHRLDQPALHNEVRVVADDLNEEHVAGAFRKFGEVSSCVRGAASISRIYKPGDISLVWDGIWHLSLKVAEGVSPPTS